LKALLDTNIILDVWLLRTPYEGPASELLTKIEEGTLGALLCATSLTTLHYFARKHSGERRARHDLRQLLQLCEVAPVTRSTIDQALARSLSDFEDAVIAASAKQAGADVLVTRNIKDFKNSGIPVMTCSEVLVRLKQS